MITVIIDIPKWFKVVSGVGVLWYLLASIGFTFEALASTLTLVEHFGEEAAEIMVARPPWVLAVYALWCYGGLVGCILLLSGGRLAFRFLQASVAGMALQQCYWWFGMDIANVFSEEEWALPFLIPAISFFMLWLSRHAVVNWWVD